MPKTDYFDKLGAGYIPPGEACGCREVPREGCIPPLQTEGTFVVVPKPGNNPRPVRGVEDAAPYNENHHRSHIETGVSGTEGP